MTIRKAKQTNSTRRVFTDNVLRRIQEQAPPTLLSEDKLFHHISDLSDVLHLNLLEARSVCVSELRTYDQSE